jgi:GT2 family glycosyltransferase
VLDQDDLMAQGRLARQLAALDADPGADAVYSDYERVRADGTLIDRFVSRQASRRELLHAMAASTSPIAMQTMTIRKSSFTRFGGFSEDRSLTGLDDGEFFVRLAISGARLVYVPGVAGRWVSHSGNYSKGRQFHETRLRFLARLEALAAGSPMLLAELDNFRAHIHVMRGIYFLEQGLARRAVREFLETLRARPFWLNAYYLLIKSLFLSTLRPGRGSGEGRRE